MFGFLFEQDRKFTLKVFQFTWIYTFLFQGKFLWPGYGDNARVLDWIVRRINEEENTAKSSAIGFIPSETALHLEGIEDQVNLQQLFSLPKDFWEQEVS